MGRQLDSVALESTLWISSVVGRCNIGDPQRVCPGQDQMLTLTAHTHTQHSTRSIVAVERKEWGG
eukprot:2407562-Amphidinium_carterae.1